MPSLLVVIFVDTRGSVDRVNVATGLASTVLTSVALVLVPAVDIVVAASFVFVISDGIAVSVEKEVAARVGVVASAALLSSVVEPTVP